MPIEVDHEILGPYVKYPHASENKTYELLMIDYQMFRTRNDKEQWLIWHVPSIPGSQFKKGYDGRRTKIVGKTDIMSSLDYYTTFNISSIWSGEGLPPSHNCCI